MTGNKDEQAMAVAATTAGTGRSVARPARPARRVIDGAARDRIGRGLRLHYAGVLALPIPDRMRILLDDLAACSDTEVQS